MLMLRFWLKSYAQIDRYKKAPGMEDTPDVEEIKIAGFGVVGSQVPDRWRKLQQILCYQTFVARVGVDTAENEPRKDLGKLGI